MSACSHWINSNYSLQLRFNCKCVSILRTANTIKSELGETVLGIVSAVNCKAVDGFSLETLSSNKILLRTLKYKTGTEPLWGGWGSGTLLDIKLSALDPLGLKRQFKNCQRWHPLVTGERVPRREWKTRTRSPVSWPLTQCPFYLTAPPLTVRVTLVLEQIKPSAMAAKAYMLRTQCSEFMTLLFPMKIKEECRCDFPMTTSFALLESHFQEGTCYRTYIYFWILNLLLQTQETNVCTSLKRILSRIL